MEKITVKDYIDITNYNDFDIVKDTKEKGLKTNITKHIRNGGRMKNSIKEITFVKNEIKNTRILFEEVGCYTFFDKDLCKAIEHILSDYERALKENEKKDELIERMKTFLLKENKMCDFLESEE